MNSLVIRVLFASVAMPIGLLACGTSSATTIASPPVEAQTQKPKANPPVSFAHTRSDLMVDPAARFGRLANGLTYVIYKNKTPPGSAAVWMRVGAGAVMEQEHQRGLAHFIEHMAFNGSKNVPEGEMVKLLQRDGLQFGADTNAQTSDFETVYTLNLPDTQDRIVDDALFLMREVAGNLTLDPAAINRERGIILGEERARAGVGMEAYEALRKTMFAGTTYADRIAIGKVEIIKTAQRPAFAQFYTDFYRPEYTTLIVAGDIDPDRIEAEIRQRFADWRPGTQSPAASTDFGAMITREVPFPKVFVGDGLPDVLSIHWAMPPVDVVETKAKDFDDLLMAMATGILSERFARLADVPGAALLGAGFDREDIAHTARMYSLNIRPRDGQQAAAFAQSMAMLREFITNGPTQAELDRALLQYYRGYSERVAGARTIPSQAIAGQILASLGSDRVLQSPAQGLAVIEELKPSFTLGAINAALKRIRLDQPPVLWRQGSQVAPFDETAMLNAWRTAMAAPVKTIAGRPSVSWPYTAFDAPSAVVTREVMPLIGATRARFANGVVLTVKQTAFEDNAVNISVEIGNGLLGVRRDQSATLFMAGQVGLFAGGLGKLPSDDIREALAGRIYSLGFGIGDTAAILSGATTRADVGVQLQLLAAFMTDPAFRDAPFDRMKADLPSSYASRRTSPDGIFAMEASQALHDGDPRFGTPPEPAALAVGNDRVAALLKDQLSHGPVAVTIVGDIAPDEAIRQVGATLGALSPLDRATPVSDLSKVRFPTTNLRKVYTHNGRADQNLSAIVWPTTDYYANPRRAAALDLLAAVMTSRELEDVREKQGASYSASASSMMSDSIPGYGYILSKATVRPEIDETYYRTVSAIADELGRRPVTPDELFRARQPMIDHLRNQRNGNGYWLSLLSGSVREPRQISSAITRERDLLSITPKDIQRAARSYLVRSKALRIQVKSIK